jgi:hypothetical protein
MVEWRVECSEWQIYGLRHQSIVYVPRKQPIRYIDHSYCIFFFFCVVGFFAVCLLLSPVFINML